MAASCKRERKEREKEKRKEKRWPNKKKETGSRLRCLLSCLPAADPCLPSSISSILQQRARKGMSSLMDYERAVDVARSEDGRSFAEFFDQWIAEQDRLLQLLLAAAASDDGDDDLRRPSQNGGGGGGGDGVEERRLREQKIRPLVEQVLGHYERYYRVKRAYAAQDAAAMFDPCWRSSSEKMFMWICGWQPSMAVQLLYSMSGIQLQHRLDDVLRGVPTGDLAELSADQIGRVDELHRKTVQREREITEEAAQAQETVAGTDVVELSHVLTEMKHARGGEEKEETERDRVRRMEAEMAPRKGMLEKVLESADALRLETLKSVAGILRPLQAAHFLIAAAEVHLRVHEWGKTMDGAGSNRGGTGGQLNRPSEG